MELPRQFKCDVCGHEGVPDFRWWHVTIRDGIILLMRWLDPTRVKPCKDCCGQSCALKAVSEYTATTTPSTT